MAEIVFGFACSHGPQLSMPPDTWDLRSEVDRVRGGLTFRDGTFTYDQLLKLRDCEPFARQNQPAVRAEYYRRSQVALDILTARLAAVNPDAVVLIGNDQHEWFHHEIQPALCVLTMPRVLNKKIDLNEYAHAPGIDLAAPGWRPPEDAYYPIQTDLAKHIALAAIDDGFDVTVCAGIPQGQSGPLNITHSLSYVVRRIMKDDPQPLVPILLNTFYPPNRVKPGRCLDFGKALANAIRSWNGSGAPRRIALCASGGLSHYVIDEEWDRKFLDAMLRGDEEVIRREPNAMFQGGTSEMKNWITLSGAMSTTRHKMQVVDYVPCYRTAAGTGNAMGFAIWE